jgi:hypothetical protein
MNREGRSVAEWPPFIDARQHSDALAVRLPRIASTAQITAAPFATHRET